MYAQWQTTDTGLTYVLPTGTPAKNSTTTNTLTVSYNANGGSSTPTSQTSSKTVTYSFKGWFTAASGGTQRTTSSRVTEAETVYSQFNSTTGAQASITLSSAITHANTTPTTYTVTFNANGGSSTKTSQTAAVTRTWAFNGWHEGSASGTSHAASSSFTPSANVTMYAGWDTSDSTASVTLPTAAQCTRTGHTLLGFSTSSTATTATYAPGATYTPSATIELFAVWERNDIVKIYTGTQWVLAPSYIYKDGAWTQFTVIKIYDGS
ncbi:MAG: InlB B-repeat-containing protein [Bacteroidota bacterium]|nr:InlB B-repeat-containing protein [Bacteroidota bacterium]